MVSDPPGTHYTFFHSGTSPFSISRSLGRSRIASSSASDGLPRWRAPVPKNECGNCKYYMRSSRKYSKRLAKDIDSDEPGCSSAVLRTPERYVVDLSRKIASSLIKFGLELPPEEEAKNEEIVDLPKPPVAINPAFPSPTSPLISSAGSAARMFFYKFIDVPIDQLSERINFNPHTHTHFSTLYYLTSLTHTLLPSCNLGVDP